MNIANKLINVLKNGGVAVIPTDTIYGVVGQALNQETVNRIYKVKGRTPTKPFIILISDFADLKKFGVEEKGGLKNFWPGPVSVILKCEKPEFEYLQRGTKSLGFRMPIEQNLRNLIKEVGPLVAPSANPEGEEPATNIKKAREYFGNKIDFYFDGGEVSGNPSTLIDYKGEELEILRGRLPALR